MDMDAGMTFDVSLPKSILHICEIKSPTQPICPHMETTEEVIIAEQIITVIRI